jgi:CrcB protein
LAGWRLYDEVLMQAFLLVGVGGALGSMARYGFGLLAGKAWPTAFPIGTLLINIIGSLVMGLFIGFMARTLPSWQPEGRLFVAVGILGGFTTFSSFSLDTITLIERGDIGPAMLYVLLSVAISLLGLYLGLLAMRGSVA